MRVSGPAAPGHAARARGSAKEKVRRAARKIGAARALAAAGNTEWQDEWHEFSDDDDHGEGGDDVPRPVLASVPHLQDMLFTPVHHSYQGVDHLVIGPLELPWN